MGLLPSKNKKIACKALFCGPHKLSKLTPNFVQIENNGFCTWCLVVGKGLLIPATLSVGVCKYKKKLYGFVNKWAAAEFKTNPEKLHPKIYSLPSPKIQIHFQIPLQHHRNSPNQSGTDKFPGQIRRPENPSERATLRRQSCMRFVNTSQRHWLPNRNASATIERRQKLQLECLGHPP